jgi:hypothetical protein
MYKQIGNEETLENHFLASSNLIFKAIYYYVYGLLQSRFMLIIPKRREQHKARPIE